MVTVHCGKCKKILGQFDAEDDHSGVIMKCPYCHTKNTIYNQILSFPEDYCKKVKGNWVYPNEKI